MHAYSSEWCKSPFCTDKRTQSQPVLRYVVPSDARNRSPVLAFHPTPHHEESAVLVQSAFKKHMCFFVLFLTSCFFMCFLVLFLALKCFFFLILGK